MALAGTLGFLGYGNMGQAILKGLLKGNTLAPQNAHVFDADHPKVDAAVALGAHKADSAADLARVSDSIILATKPQDMHAALLAMKPGCRPTSLIISIAAGISIPYIQDRLGPAARVARVMPNTPAMVGAGAAAIAISPSCTASDAQTARTIFEAIGIAELVPEEHMDLITALSGSGPAYFFLLVECMVEAAVAGGLPREQAIALAGQTCYGAGKLLRESGESPATLRERVTSKGGTTFAALETFRARDFPGTVSAALSAAARRSKELGQ